MKSTTHKAAGGAILAIGLLGLTSMPVLAGDDAYKPMDAPAERSGFGIKGELSIELQSDHTYESDDPDAELSDTYTTTELGIEAMFGRHVSLVGGFVLEPVLDPGPGEDRFFEDLGLYAEELYGRVTLFSGLSVFGGKFNPAFGTAWDVTPGLYGTDFAEDYETTERLGFGAAIEREAGGLGTLTLTSSFYHLDTSELSRSLFTDRGKTSVADGGVSNTEDLDSFAITLDAAEAPVLGGANLHLGYRFQKQGKTPADLADERGYVAGLNGTRSLNGVEISWIGEVVYLDNAEGTLDDTFYYTLGGGLKFANRYNIAVAYTGRPRDVAGGGDLDDRQIQVSAGVELAHGWELDAGYKYHVEGNVDNHTVGLLFAKAIEFGGGAR